MRRHYLRAPYSPFLFFIPTEPAAAGERRDLRSEPCYDSRADKLFVFVIPNGLQL
jgi:hypothetical protein